MSKTPIEKGSFGANFITKHNDFIKTYSDLNVTEYKLLLGCISKVNSFAEITSDTPFSFSMEEAMEVFNFDYKNSAVIATFREAARQLITKIIPLSELGEDFHDTSIAHGAKYSSKDKLMTIWFSPGVIPFISGLRNNLTTYRIMHIGKMRSKHAIRLYELLIMWMSKDYEHEKVKEFKFDEVKELLGLAGEYENGFTMFRKKVLDVAENQINELTDLNLKIIYKKTEKKYTHVEFNFSYKPEWIKFESEFKESKKLSKEQIRKIINHKEFYDKYFGAWLNKNRDKDVGMLDWVSEVEAQLKENPYAYYPEYSRYLN